MNFIRIWFYELVRSIVCEILTEPEIRKEIETIEQNKKALAAATENEKYLKSLREIK